VIVLNVDLVDVRTPLVSVTVNSVLQYRADVTDDGAVYGLFVRDDNDTDVPGGKYAGRVGRSVGRARISCTCTRYIYHLCYFVHAGVEHAVALE